MEPDSQSVTEYLHSHIPITAQMGVRAVTADELLVRLEAPLEPNLNHQWTAFGGSIASIGVLACWCLVQVRLHVRGIDAQLVIRNSTIDFIRPALGPFQGTAVAPAEDTWEHLVDMLQRKGRGRIELCSEVTCAGKTVAGHRGVYVTRIV